LGLLESIKGVIKRMVRKDSKKAYDTDIIENELMVIEHTKWVNTYMGMPLWVNADDDVKTINFAKTICNELSRLTTLNIELHIDGGETQMVENATEPKTTSRSEYLQKRMDSFMQNIQITCEHWEEHGSLLLVPNMDGIDVITPDNFYVTNMDGNKKVTGVIYFDYYRNGKDFYTLAIWQRFQDGLYYISHKAFKSGKEDTIGREVMLTDTIWADYEPETVIDIGKEEENRPLFVLLNLPIANNIDEYSPLSMSAFGDAMNELMDLDVAYSRFMSEIYDSKKLVLLDDNLINKAGQKIGVKSDITLPRYVKMLFGNGTDDFYQEINPTIQTDARMLGVNKILDIVAYKAGFSNGYFNFDTSRGMVTATQVESEDARTIGTIKARRDVLKDGLSNLIFALNVIADLNGIPVGTYKEEFTFGDITYNYEEDKTRWYQMATSGFVPKWMYLVKFEGFTEEEAKLIQAEAEPKPEENTMFGGV
jgi:A118 family predicted phage portal protein